MILTDLIMNYIKRRSTMDNPFFDIKDGYVYLYNRHGRILACFKLEHTSISQYKDFVINVQFVSIDLTSIEYADKLKKKLKEVNK